MEQVNTTKKRGSLSYHIIRAGIILFSITFVIGLLVVLMEASSWMDDGTVSAERFYDAVTSGEYERISHLKYRHMSEETAQEVEGCIAVGDYYKAAVWYKTFENSEDAERASQEKEKMEALVSTIDQYDLEFAIKDIHSILGIS